MEHIWQKHAKTHVVMNFVSANSKSHLPEDVVVVRLAVR